MNPGIPADQVSCLEIKTPDLGGRDIYVIVAGQIIVAPDKSVTVRHDLQDALRHIAGIQLAQIHRGTVILTQEYGICFVCLALDTSLFLQLDFRAGRRRALAFRTHCRQALRFGTGRSRALSFRTHCRRALTFRTHCCGTLGIRTAC